MGARDRITRHDRFAGLSNRAVPVHLSRIESPDLLNVDFSERALAKRPGFSVVTTSRLRRSSFALDGRSAHVRFEHVSSYVVSSLSLGIDVRMAEFPSDEKFLVSKGHGTGADRYVSISYDPTINTNLGGWRLRLYDQTNTTLRNVTINDGDSTESQVGENRHIALWESTAGTYTFQVWEADGTSVGSTTLTVGSLSTNSQADDWIIGCDTSDGDTIPADGDSTFYPGFCAEFRLGDADDTDSVQVVDRELRDTEYATLLGYWRMNDGTGSEIADLGTGANPGTAGASGPQWVGPSAGALGTSALRFRGEKGHVDVDCSAWCQDFFDDTVSGFRRWTISFAFLPVMAAGETTVRDQTLLRFGSDTTGTAAPEPLDVRVVSDLVVVRYVDGTGTNTLTATGFPLSTAATNGETVRIAIEYSDQTSNELVNLKVYRGASTAVSVGNSGVGGNPPTFASSLSIGRTVNSFALPQTFQGKSAFGTIDDLAFHRDYTPSNGISPYFSAQQYRPVNGVEISLIDSLPGSPGVTLVCGVPLNDGSGSTPITRGSATSSASIFPQSAGELSWGPGLVEQDCPVEITLLEDYRRQDPKLGVVRRALAVSGTTLYEIDLSTGSYEEISGALLSGGIWTMAQYGTSVYLASANGRRPYVWNGSTLSFVGIEAPNIGPTVASDTVSGSIAAGTYHVYVTFRNSSTGVESNPSPFTSFTLGSTGRVTQIDIPLSTDPQVNQRRIWVTQANGGAGSTAIPWVTIDDNTTTSYTTAITSAVPAVGAVTLEYLENEEAPTGSLVAIHYDRLIVAGNPEFPTRFWYSLPGQLESFNQGSRFEDSDQDAGDPIVGLHALRDLLVVYLRDGRVGWSVTGETSPVYLRTDLDRTTGAVAHHAILPISSSHFFFGEQDVHEWNGSRDYNLSSPPEAERPAIQDFVRNEVDTSQYAKIDMAHYRGKKQLWIALSRLNADRNDHVLVFDTSQGVWSRYDLDLDRVNEIEDQNDQPQLYGARQGHIVRLDSGTGDGANVVGSVTGGTTTTVVDTSQSWGVDDYKGLYVWVRDVSGEVVERRLIKRNDATTLHLDSAMSFVPAAGDAYSIGGILWFSDFLVDAGSPHVLKTPCFIKVAGEGAGQTFRVYFQADQLKRVWSFSPQVAELVWGTTDANLDYVVGGIGHTFRVRLTDAQFDGDPAIGFPGQGFPSVHDWQFEHQDLDAR